jgi:hypothetical protein
MENGIDVGQESVEVVGFEQSHKVNFSFASSTRL